MGFNPTVVVRPSLFIAAANEFAMCLNNGEYIDALFLAFTKNFLTRYHIHERLCYKLSYYGTNEPLLSWIKDFLLVRTQKVVLDDKYSDLYPILSGVPQCIVLALLQFLLYINNMTYFCYKSDKQCHDCFIWNYDCIIRVYRILCQFDKPDWFLEICETPWEPPLTSLNLMLGRTFL